MITRKRVVVTGVGTVAPIAVGNESFLQACLEGRRGVTRLPWAEDFGLRSQVAAVVDAARLRAAAELRGVDPDQGSKHLLMGLVAAEEAMSTARLRPHALVAATAINGFTDLERSYFSGEGRPAPEDFYFDSFQTNAQARLGLRGPGRTVCTGCTSSHDAVGYAFWQVRRGRWPSALVLASESPLGPTTAAAFDVLGALAHSRNHRPETASRPFDADRDGFVPAEGAAAIVLETAESAAARGARPYAELLGYGSVSSAHHMTGIPKDGGPIYRSIHAAAADTGDAGRAIARTNYVNSHGSGTPMNDRAEAAALRAAFGARLAEIPVNSTKSLVGHALGAAGLIELSHSLLSMRAGVVTPNVNVDRPDPDIDLYLPDRPLVPFPFDVALKTGSGFSGIHSALFLGSWPGEQS
jgi:3-oxoacyl-(acyl-carrier-protein) synthase